MVMYLLLSIILVFGIVLAFRRVNLKRLRAADFPGVPSDKLEEWRRLELRSIDVFLKYGIASIVIFGLMYVFCLFPGLELLCGLLVNMGLLPLAFCVLFLVGLVLSVVNKIKATRLKKSLGPIESRGK